MHAIPDVLDRRFEGIVLDWDGIAGVPHRDGNAARLEELIEALCELGMHVAVVSGAQLGEIDRQLRARPDGPGSLLLALGRGAELFAIDRDGPHLLERRTQVEIGPAGESDAARDLFARLRARGVGARQVLIGSETFGTPAGVSGSESTLLAGSPAGVTAVSVGPEPTGTPPGVIHLGGGPARIAALLADQLDRRRRGDVPDTDDDPAWVVRFDGLDPERERAIEGLLVIADGRLGTNGSPLAFNTSTTPSVFVAGLYDGSGPETALLPCPLWHRLPVGDDAPKRLHRVLNLRSGLLHEVHTTSDREYRSMRFSSLARPASVVLRAECPAGTTARSPALVAAVAHGVETARVDGRTWMRAPASSGGVVAAASQRAREKATGDEVLERLGAYVADSEHCPEATTALDRVRGLERVGFEHLLNEHREEWAERWDEAEVTIGGDEPLQLAMRFGLFHLLASAVDHDEAAVGARGLTGAAYRGHVFWDADVFVLPALVAIHPASARAMLEYRARRLAAARTAAEAEGHKGARFPWESARTGRDVTPTHARDRTGRIVPIRTGSLEVHIVGCVAWATAHYLDWTGDSDFEAGPGGALLVETARYWASRARFDDQGRAHIYGVIGPDEYHGPVDDNAFTNVLARWNLRRAASLDDHGLAEQERAHWLEIADALVDGYDAETARYEQFAGFYDLEPLVIAEIAPRRPIAAELLLGADRVGQAQVVKQADVLMLHHLLPGEVAPGSLLPNLDYYEPRTAHGSSLSPGVHSSLLARAGRLEEAAAMLAVTARIDLDDITATTAGGLHLAAIGSAWQALAFGFLGARAHGDALALDPKVHDTWSVLEMRLRYRGTSVTIRAEGQHLSVRTSSPLPLVVDGSRYTTGLDGLAFERAGTRWKLHRGDRPANEEPSP
jgi:trehalose/maltose hydrolase-like predicted phosphorylase